MVWRLTFVGWNENGGGPASAPHAGSRGLHVPVAPPFESEHTVPAAQLPTPTVQDWPDAIGARQLPATHVPPRHWSLVVPPSLVPPHDEPYVMGWQVPDEAQKKPAFP
jgi:hypothetical protein